MRSETGPDDSAMRSIPHRRSSSVGYRTIGRRRFVRALGGSILVALAGCLGSGGDRGATTTTLDPSPVTTIGGDDVEVTAAQLLVRETDDGPRVHYRLHNRGDADATVAIRTVLEIHEGGTYEATAYLDVPAGDAAFVEYRVVRYAALAEEEAENVRRGNTDFDVYVNGERRSGVWAGPATGHARSPRFPPRRRPLRRRRVSVSF